MFKAGKIVKPTQTSQKDLNSFQNNLTSEEIALILGLIKNSPFKGADIEIIYNLVIKLQNQYTELNKNV